MKPTVDCDSERWKNVALECRKLCVLRMLNALGICISKQFILLGLFVLFVNTNFLQPGLWVSETFDLLFSFRIWLVAMPLIIAVGVYGVCLGKNLLAGAQFYNKRYKQLLGTSTNHLAFLVTHLAVGGLTAQLYASFLHIDYRYWTYECYATKCLNHRHLFLICAAMTTGCFHFIKEHLQTETTCKFPIVQVDKLLISPLVRETISKAMLSSILSVFVFTFGYWLLAGVLHQRFAHLLGVDVDEHFNGLLTLIGDVRLIFYAWILAAQILANMELIQHCFRSFLTAKMEFAVTKNPMKFVVSSEITITEALSISQLPIVQNHAAYDVYKLSLPRAANKRQELFALSTPGNHPHNWQQFCTQCLSIINAFSDELEVSVSMIASLQIVPVTKEAALKPTATETAERMLYRRYNAANGIRNGQLYSQQVPQKQTLTRLTAFTSVVVDACQRNFEQCVLLVRDINQKLYRSIPGLSYMFSEPDGAKTLFLLSNSLSVIFLSQGLANITALSMVEDKYGVVQSMLAQIIRSLFKLKTTLDKLNNVNLNGNKYDRNFRTLKSAVHRSLNQISSVFGGYLDVLFTDSEELHNLQCFFESQEM